MPGLSICAALLVAAASPAEAQAPAAAPAAYARDFASLGAWLIRLEQAVVPIGEAVAAMRGWWDSAESAGDVERGAERLRAGLAAALARLDSADAALAALDRPVFPTLPLTPDMRPEQIVRDMSTISGHIRTLLRRYSATLEAMLRNDRRAVDSGMADTVAGLRLVNSAHVLMRRAALAATPRSESSWEMLNIQLLLFRVPGRLLESWEAAGGAGRDPALAGDLLRFADELDATAGAGAAKLEREIAGLTASLAAAERRGARAEAGNLRNSVAVRTVDRAIFPIAREMAAVLREEAARFAGGTFTVGALGAVVRRFHPFRDRLQDVIRQENAIAAGAR